MNQSIHQSRASGRKHRLLRGALSAVALCLLTLNSGMSEAQDFVDAEIVAPGYKPTMGDELMVFIVLESWVGQDLTGDGRLSSLVLQYRCVSDSSVVNTGIPVAASWTATSGSRIAFLQDERNVGADLTGDHDQRDRVLAHYNVDTGEVVYTSVVPYIHAGQAAGVRTLSMEGNIISYVVRESYQNDINGDGDTADTLVRYYDIADGQVHDTFLAAPSAVLNQGRMATNVFEGSMNADLNGDGDMGDNVIVVYDLQTGEIIPVFATPSYNLTSSGSFPALSGDHLVFRTHESRLGEDVDGDGRLSTINIMMHYHLPTGQLSYLGFRGGLNGRRLFLENNILAYDTAEFYIGEDLNGDGDLNQDFTYALHNLETQETVYHTGSDYSFGAGGFFVQQSESRTSLDVNQDGDTSDYYVYFVGLSATGECQSDDIPCRLLSLISVIEGENLADWLQTELVDQIEVVRSTFSNQGLDDAARLEQSLVDFDGFFSLVNSYSRQDLSWASSEAIMDTARPIKDQIHVIRDDFYAQLEASENESSGGEGSGGPGDSLQSMLASVFAQIENAGLDSAIEAQLLGHMNAIVSIATSSLPEEQKVAEALAVLSIFSSDVSALQGAGVPDALADFLLGFISAFGAQLNAL